MSDPLAKVQLDYDMNEIDIIDTINAGLHDGETGIQFQCCDDECGDGFIVLHLVKTDELVKM